MSEPWIELVKLGFLFAFSIAVAVGWVIVKGPFPGEGWLPRISWQRTFALFGALAVAALVFVYFTVLV